MSCLPDLLIDHGLFGFPFFTSLARMMIEFEGQIFIRYILVNNEDLTPLTFPLKPERRRSGGCMTSATAQC